MQKNNFGRLIIKEACVEDLAQAIKAEQLGADRIELCANLQEDGLTPDFQTITAVRQQLKIPVRVMVRPHAKSFTYHEKDLEEMIRTIRFCHSAGVEGVVFGALHDNGEVDMGTTKMLIENAKGLKTVFHRAVDYSADWSRAVSVLLQESRLDAILTSGGPGGCMENKERISSLLAKSGNTEIVVCGKVTRENFQEVDRTFKNISYHGRKIVGDVT